MKTVQVVLGSELLREADGAAKRARVNRSALIRQALREHLRRAATRESEACDRQGYEERPEATTVVEDWDQVASWPAL